jgi:hypothetical protein
MRLLVIVLLAGLAACSASPQTQPKPTPVSSPEQPAETASLYERLLEQADGAPVFVVASDSGIVARTEDRVLHTLTKETGDAEYSFELDLVWLVSEGVLSVIDLRDSDPKPIALVRDVADTPVAIVGKLDTWIGGSGVPEYLQLDWSREQKLSLELAFGEIMNPDVATAILRAKLVGGAWLTQNLDRELRKDEPTVPDTKRSKGPVSACDDQEQCAKSVDFGASGWELYVARYQCGDYCYWDCLLFDPKSGKLAEPAPIPDWKDKPEEMAGSCGPYYFDNSGTSDAISDKVCRIGHGCNEQEGIVLGPLRPGTVINLAGE